MSDRPLLTREQLAFLEALREAGVSYMVVGMSAAILQGCPGTTQDIDLWVGPGQGDRMAEACRRVGAVYLWRADPPAVGGEGLDDFDLVWHCDGLRSFEEESRGAVEVDLGGVVVGVLPLDRVVASKRAANRPKDRASMPMLRDALRVLRELARRG